MTTEAKPVRAESRALTKFQNAGKSHASYLVSPITEAALQWVAASHSSPRVEMLLREAIADNGRVGATESAAIQYVGLDVSQKETELRQIDDAGSIVT